jgi:hypothetical protein
MICPKQLMDCLHAGVRILYILNASNWEYGLANTPRQQTGAKYKVLNFGVAGAQAKNQNTKQALI